MQIQEKYKIVAFCSLVKYHRRDSCIRKDKKKYRISQEFGMCTNSFSKYFKLCRDLGLMRELKSNYQLIGLPEIIRKLGLDLDRHCRWTNYDEYEKVTFKSVYDRVVFSPIIKNFNQQQYKINKKQKRLERVFSNSNLSMDQKLTKRIAKEAARAGVTFESYIERMLDSFTRTIVSGKYHVANLIGYSATSGSRWLRKMVENGIIDRKVKWKDAGLPVTHASYDVLIEERRRENGSYAVIPSSRGFRLSLGSSINLMLK